MSDFLNTRTISVPATFGPLKNATGNARLTGPCGDTMEMWLRIEGETIERAHYTTDGCGSSHAAGATACAIITGAQVAVAEQLGDADILAMAGGAIAPTDTHCALLAANTLKACLKDAAQRSYRLTRTGDKREASMRSVLNPKPPLLVSCRSATGQDNALVVVYAGNCSFDPPSVMVGIVPSRFSYNIIKETGCFVVNLTPPEMKEAYDYLGSKSGRDGDKLKAIGVRTRDGIKVKAPILIDCPVNIECTVVDSIRTGSHEMFIERIEYVHADAELTAADGTIDWSKVRFL